jgi:hypothetical protein
VGKGRGKVAAGRYHRRLGDHAAVDQFPVCSSLDFSCTPLYIHLYVYRRTSGSISRKIRLVA